VSHVILRYSGASLMVALLIALLGTWALLGLTER